MDDNKGPTDGFSTLVLDGKTKPKPKAKRNGRKKGCKKSGGRVAGTPNKRTQSFAIELDKYGFNIAEQIAKLFKATADISTKIRLLELAAKYRLPIPFSGVEAPEISDEEQPDLLKIVND